MTEPGPLPEVLDLAAVGRAFGLTRSGARRAVLRGELGPFFTVGRRMFLRRDSLLAAVAAREVTPAPAAPPPVPEAPEWASRLLRRGNGVGGRR